MSEREQTKSYKQSDIYFIYDFVEMRLITKQFCFPRKRDVKHFTGSREVNPIMRLVHTT